MRSGCVYYWVINDSTDQVLEVGFGWRILVRPARGPRRPYLRLRFYQIEWEGTSENHFARFPVDLARFHAGIFV